ncbi:MAG: DUF3267 domain-containing protein [Candidatus Kapaibacteriota bacterium]
MQTLTNTASVAHFPTETKRDVSISLGAANLYFLPALVLALLLLLPFTALYGWSSVKEGLRTFFDGFSFVVVFLLGIVIHEALHGITWMLAGKISPQNIRYGVKWKVLTPYAHAKIPMQASAYRIGVVMPLLVLGVVPYCVSLVIGNPWLLWFGFVFITAAIGDILVLWLLRGIDGKMLVEDHPNNAGCFVYDQHQRLVS